MALLEQDLRTGLLADSALSTLLGGGRLYPGLLPQEGTQFPSVTYSLVSVVRRSTYTLAGMKRARIQLDAFATTYGGACTLVDERKRVIDSSTVWGTTTVQGTVLESERDVDFSVNRQVFRRMVDYSLWVNKA